MSISLKENYNNSDFNTILTNIRAASLSLLIVPIINFYRGYLQGHLKILPTALSLILENLFKVILILTLIMESSSIFILEIFSSADKITSSNACA